MSLESVCGCGSVYGCNRIVVSIPHNFSLFSPLGGLFILGPGEGGLFHALILCLLFFKCIIKQLLNSVFVICKIIKVEVSVISRADPHPILVN